MLGKPADPGRRWTHSPVNQRPVSQALLGDQPGRRGRGHGLGRGQSSSFGDACLSHTAVLSGRLSLVPGTLAEPRISGQLVPRFPPA